MLLIFAGITIQVIFNGGIIDQTLNAKEKHIVEQLREKIEVTKSGWWINKQLDNKVTIDNFWEKLIAEDIIKSKADLEGPEKEGNDNIYMLNTKESYTVEVIEKPDGSITIGNIVKTNSIPPKIKAIQVTNKTSNSIEVKVEVSRLEDGKLSYYYKKEEEKTYHELKTNVTDITASYTGLEQNKVYNIKVVAKNKKGTAELVVNDITGELETGVISQKGQTSWADGKASIELETSNTSLVLKYQVGSINENSWIPYEGAILNLNHNDNVYAVLTDGTNYGETATIIIKDETAPSVTVTKGTVSTNSIQVSVTSTDGQWGMPESPSYSYYIKKKTESSYPTTANHTGSETSWTFSGLAQTTDYDIKVTTKDKAQNEGTGLLSAKTGTVGGASSNLQTGNITASSPTWNSTSHTASVTLSTTTNLQIQYQKNGIEGTWETVPAGQKSVTIANLNHGDNVYARLYDGTNAGDEAYVAIRDGQEPNSAIISVTPTTLKLEAKVTGTVTQTDNQSGVNLSKSKWMFNTTSTVLSTTSIEWNNATTFSTKATPEFTPTGKGSYYLHVLTVDNGGNKTVTISNEIVVKWDSNKIAEEIKQGDKSAPLPIGFVQSGIEKEQNINTGLVIYQVPDAEKNSISWIADTNSNGILDVQEKYNQFVWVPVENPSEMFGTDKDGNSLGKLYRFDNGVVPATLPLRGRGWIETEGENPVMSWITSTLVREPYVL